MFVAVKARTAPLRFTLEKVLISSSQRSSQLRGSARRSGHRMQPYGIKIRFQSGCSAGEARCVRDAEVGGSNPLTPTNFLTKYVVTNTTSGDLALNSSGYAALTNVKILALPLNRGAFLCPNLVTGLRFESGTHNVPIPSGTG